VVEDLKCGVNHPIIYQDLFKQSIAEDLNNVGDVLLVNLCSWQEAACSLSSIRTRKVTCLASHLLCLNLLLYVIVVQDIMVQQSFDSRT
jgi:hypothetical protein